MEPSNFTVALGKTEAHHTNFKKTRPVKKRTIWGTFGPKFQFFFKTSLWPSEGIAAGVPIYRAAVTSIGQRNPTRTPKTLWFCAEKQDAKIPIFDFAKKDRFFRCTFCVLDRGAPPPAGAAAMVAEVPCNLTPQHPPSQVLDNLPRYGY